MLRYAFMYIYIMYMYSPDGGSYAVENCHARRAVRTHRTMHGAYMYDLICAEYD